MITVLDTGIANAASVLYALERLGHKPLLSHDPEDLTSSSKIILPGVGTATALFERLHSLELMDCLRRLKQPVLGICLGMQALYTHSEEGETTCLGILKGRVTRLSAHSNFGQTLTVPHMGWNQIHQVRESRLLREIPENSNFYYVHSFAAALDTTTVATTEYGSQFSAVVEFENWFGTQFHPERSGSWGEKLLSNFLDL